jgi:hypothetical protein
MLTETTTTNYHGGVEIIIMKYIINEVCEICVKVRYVK